MRSTEEMALQAKTRTKLTCKNTHNRTTLAKTQNIHTDTDTHTHTYQFHKHTMRKEEVFSYRCGIIWSLVALTKKT